MLNIITIWTYCSILNMCRIFKSLRVHLSGIDFRILEGRAPIQIRYRDVQLEAPGVLVALIEMVPCKISGEPLLWTLFWRGLGPHIQGHQRDLPYMPRLVARLVLLIRTKVWYVHGRWSDIPFMSRSKFPHKKWLRGDPFLLCFCKKSYIPFWLELYHLIKYIGNKNEAGHYPWNELSNKYLRRRFSTSLDEGSSPS